ncbi:MAG: hypothetical protein QOH57_4269, partial [Mycobacterium sp.]|nr:hypothetical protein [Mycobacterium sp.]
IVGTMGLVLALLFQAVLLPRFGLYFHLLRLDLVAMWLFVVSASIVLFGLRPVARFAWVWGLLLGVFSLPYYLVVVLFGGGKFAAGAATLLIAGVGTGIAGGPTLRRGFVGSMSAWVVGFAVLITIAVVFPDSPVRIYQQVPALTAICVVTVLMYFRARRGVPKRVLDRKVEPLAAHQVWAAVPLVVMVTFCLAVVGLPVAAGTTVNSGTDAGNLIAGRPLVAPPGWDTAGSRNYQWVERFYGDNAVLVRQQLTAVTPDPRFDKLSRPRTVVVDSIVSERPLSFDVYPTRVLYDLTGARLSPARSVDLGHGVTGEMVSVVDDTLLITWNSLRFVWGDGDRAQLVSIFTVDNHEPGAPFPQPSDSMVSTLRTLFTLLFRGNAVLDARAPTIKDLELLTEFGRALVGAQLDSFGRTR